MEITPNSNIYILYGVPLNSKYNDTILFDNVAAQHAYFVGKAKYTLTNQMYVRKSDGVVRVEKKAEDVYNCNYLMFQNDSFGSKWFYAFINDVKYVNNGRCDIYFEIDVLQTWLTEMVMRPCYVEREHSYTDNVGDNLVPEPINLEDIKCFQMSWDTERFEQYSIVIQHANFSS